MPLYKAGWSYAEKSFTVDADKEKKALSVRVSTDTPDGWWVRGIPYLPELTPWGENYRERLEKVGEQEIDLLFGQLYAYQQLPLVLISDVTWQFDIFGEWWGEIWDIQSL